MNGNGWNNQLTNKPFSSVYFSLHVARFVRNPQIPGKPKQCNKSNFTRETWNKLHFNRRALPLPPPPPVLILSLFRLFLLAFDFLSCFLHFFVFPSGVSVSSVIIPKGLFLLVLRVPVSGRIFRLLLIFIHFFCLAIFNSLLLGIFLSLGSYLPPSAYIFPTYLF